MRCVCLDDYRQLAKSKLSKEVFSYIDSGAEDEQTRFQNHKAFERIMIMPRILASTDQTSTKVTILGRQMSLPFGFAPSAMHSLIHEDGQLISAQVCAQKNICFTLSNLSTKSLAQVSERNKNGVRLLQMYISNDWGQTIKTIKLAQKYGFDGIVITVDTQVYGKRSRSDKYKISTTKYRLKILEEITGGQIIEREKNLNQRDLTLNWNTLKQIRMLTKLKIIIKGLTHPQDAKIATNICDAIWVSNHGGRQLDTMPPTIQILPKIKQAVGNGVEIYVDGGVLTGGDVFKCLALGANYVFIGRSVMYSLIDGIEGVHNLVNILEDELKRTMILSGTTTIQQINPKFIKYLPSL